MEVKNVLNMANEANNIKNAYAKWKEITKKPDCDKYHFEFNRDDRFLCCGKHIMFLSNNVGYFGSNGCHESFKLDSAYKEKFWKCFDAYCNEHIEDILRWIARGFEQEASDNLGELKKEIENLNEVVKKLEEIKAANLK